MTTTAPFGSWTSPISAQRIASESLGLSSPHIAGEVTYWLELRPAEGGRLALVRREPDGHTRDLVPPPFNVRTRVHEYGGGAYTVAGEVAYASNFTDQRLYRISPGENPTAVTPNRSIRYADGFIDAGRQRWVGVCELHEESGEVCNLIGAVYLADGAMRPLADGHDFVAAPRMSPDGAWLSWLSWDHPNMPWDGTSLWLAPIAEDGLLGEPRRIAGGVDESIVQPTWSPNGQLCFASDRSGYWSLYRWRDDRAEPLCERQADFSVPLWMLGASTYGFASGDVIVCAYNRAGEWQLASLSTESKELVDIGRPYSAISGLDVSGDRAVFVGGTPLEAPAVLEVNLSTGATTVLRRAFEIEIDRGFISVPEAIAFPTRDGGEAHAFFYPPANRDFRARNGELPPLLVLSHGGPTSATSSALRLSVQFWTSRGFAVVDVNYRGSTGYGRRYRNALRGRWGVLDVDDCCDAARFLAGEGRVDPERLAIRGGSAGGFTTLCALAFRDVFKAGASHFGVSDLVGLAEETHKFESRYLDRLVGPYPERAELYRERSPLAHADQITCPVIFLQGLEDRVVPPSQSERMVDALKENGVPVAYVAFEGEQHGFRKAASIVRALEAELSFYGRIFGFELAGEIEPVVIENL